MKRLGWTNRLHASNRLFDLNTRKLWYTRQTIDNPSNIIYVPSLEDKRGYISLAAWNCGGVNDEEGHSLGRGYAHKVRIILSPMSNKLPLFKLEVFLLGKECFLSSAEAIKQSKKLAKLRLKEITKEQTLLNKLVGVNGTRERINPIDSVQPERKLSELFNEYE